jgi:hypothetical protein
LGDYCSYLSLKSQNVDINKFVIYSETSLNRTLIKPALLNIGRFFKSLLNISLRRKSHKAGHPSKPTIILVPVLAGFEKFHCVSKLKEILEVK